MSLLFPLGHLETAHTIFSKLASLSREHSGVSHLLSGRIVSPLFFHFRLLNSVPGSISESVIGSFRQGWACCGVSHHSCPSWGEELYTRTHCSLQNLPMPLISKTLQACIWKVVLRLKATSHFGLPTQNIFVLRNEEDFEIVLDYIVKGH